MWINRWPHLDRWLYVDQRLYADQPLCGSVAKWTVDRQLCAHQCLRNKTSIAKMTIYSKVQLVTSADVNVKCKFI